MNTNDWLFSFLLAQLTAKYKTMSNQKQLNAQEKIGYGKAIEDIRRFQIK